jgi:hypothetical protein
MTEQRSNDLPTDFQQSLELISKLFSSGCSLDIISSSLGISLDLVNKSVALQLKDPANMQRLLDCSTEKSLKFRSEVSQSLMLDPVLAPDGKVYDRPFIEAWLHTSSSSPLTGSPMPEGRLIGQIDFQEQGLAYCRATIHQLEQMFGLGLNSRQAELLATDCLVALHTDYHAVSFYRRLSKTQGSPLIAIMQALKEQVSYAKLRGLHSHLISSAECEAAVLVLTAKLINHSKTDQFASDLQTLSSRLDLLLSKPELATVITELAVNCRTCHLERLSRL